jgi:hypothetical protein
MTHGDDMSPKSGAREMIKVRVTIVPPGIATTPSPMRGIIGVHNNIINLR